MRALGWEAAGCGSQLAALLAEPAAVELLARLPAAGRILRPLLHLLTLGPRPRPDRSAPVAAAPAPTQAPASRESATFGEVAFRSPGYTWYVVPTPPWKPG